LHIGIFTTRNSRYHPNRRLIEAATACGHEVSLIDLKKCLSLIGTGKLAVEWPVHVHQPDALLPRFGSTINDYALAVVRHLELTGARVVNGFRSILLARSKFLGLQTLAQNGIPVPKSLLVRDFKAFERAVRMFGGFPVIVKTLNSRQGRGVTLVESIQMAEFITENILRRRNGLLVQEFIPPQKRRDIRVLVVGGRVVGAMELEPRDGDFRSNIHLKGKSRPLALAGDLKDLAIRSSRIMGLEISGADIIVDAHGSAKVIEVNYSPGFRGLEAVTGLDIASLIVAYVTQTHGGTS